MNARALRIVNGIAGSLFLVTCFNALAAAWTSDTHVLASGDFNNDGRADLLVIANDPAQPSGIALNNGSGEPSVYHQSWASTYLGITWSGGTYVPYIGDFNSDNYDDIFLQRTSSGNHYVLLNDGAGRFTQIHQSISNSYLGVSWSQAERRIVVGNFNNSGGDDLFLQANGTAVDNVVALSSGGATSFLSVSPPTPWPNAHVSLEWSLLKAIDHAGDFNGDGYADWFVHAKPNWVMIPFDELAIPIPVYRPSSYGIALADGTGRAATLGQAWNHDYLGFEWSPLQYDALVANFGGDQCADILLQAKQTGNPSRMIISQCGSQPFASPTVHVLAAGVSWDQTSYQLRAGDFNGDGRADIYMQAMAGGTNRIAYTDSNGNVTTTPATHAPSGNFKKPVPGVVPGGFTVGNQGEGTYSIPINAPAATGGLRPTLGLSYNHLAGNGLAGMGWSLSGIAAITRCGRTYAQDGSVTGIAYTNADAFCLNGQRLVAITGSHGATGTEYRTEIETFQRVVQLGTQSGGPDSFRVDHGNGLSSYFGTTADSRIEVTGGGSGAAVKLWYISHTEDRFGNRIKYTYTENNTTGETVPNEVLWTERQSAPTLAPLYKATIVYEDRPAGDIRTGYDSAGKAWAATKRIDRIDVHYDGTQLIHSYDLTYAAAGATGRSRLEQVQLCGPNECMPPTTFTVQSATSGWGAAVNTGFSSGTGPVFAGDLNSDARKDVIVVGSDGDWHVHLGNAAGSIGAAVDTGISAGPNPYSARILNYDGTDRLLFKSSSTWRMLATSSGASYIAADTFTSTPDNATIVDYDGDGIQDWLYVEGGALKWRRDLGGNFAIAEPLSGFAGTTLYQHTGRRAPDFNGDGRGDLIEVGEHCEEWPPYGTFCTPRTRILVASGTAGYSAIQELEGDLFADIHVLYVNAVDLNGDGLDDLAYVVDDSFTVSWYTRLSTGTGFAPAVATGISGSSVPDATFADYDSDGREDLIYSNGSTLYVHRSNGTTFGALTASLSSTGYPGAADLSGDGFEDLIVAPFGGTLRVHKHQTALPDVIIGVTDGLGYRVGVQYESLVNSANYTVNGAPPTPPYTRYLTYARYAVVAEDHDDGIGGTRTFDHFYDTAYLDVSGRGWFEFATHRVEDVARGTRTVTYFSQTFPTVGSVGKQELRRSSDNQLIRETVNDVQSTAITGATPNRQFVRTESSTTKEYEVGGVANGQHLRTVSVDPAYDSTYGYLTSMTRVASNPAGTESTTSATVFTRPATPLLTPWCLDVPDVVETTNTLVPATSTAPPRKMRYFRNSTTCAVTETRDESETSTAKQLKTTFTYDVYGNIDVTTLDSVDGSAPDRSTDVNFDANGQFPTSVTVGGVNLTTTGTFNPLFGTRASVTGPDGLTTSFLYDDFGRVTKETWPVGDTSFVYEDCYVCWPLNARFSARAQGSDGSEAYRFFDELARPVGASWTLPQGSHGRRETRYSALGQVAQASEPYVYLDPVYWVTYQYDLLGRVTQEDAPLSEAQPTLSRTTISDYRGLERWVTDAESHTTKYVENSAGQIKQAIDALNGTTSYTYKPFGELATVQDVEGATTTIGHDARGFKTSMADPNMGSWSYDYNVYGELASQTNGAAQTVSLLYDAAGRLDLRTEPEGTTKFRYYASGVLGMGGKPDEVCLWSGTACLSTHQEKYTYDSTTGQPSQIKRTLEGAVYDFDFAFDSQGRLDLLTYPDPDNTGYRFKVDYDYDSSGELSAAKDGNTGAAFYTLGEADAVGRDLFVTLGNGVNEQRVYDRAAGNLLSIDTGPGVSSSIQDLAFTWDEVGNLKTRTNTLIGKTETLTYDALDRLDTAQVSGGGALNDVNYSAAGRITSKTDVGSYTYTGGSCGGGPEALKSAGGQSFCYDGNGRMTSHGADTFEWYSYDLPKKLAVGTKTAEFFYGVGRDRYKQIQKTGGATDATIFYAGTLFEKETAGGATTYRNHVSAGGRVIAQVSRVGTTNTVQYLHRDQQLSVVEVTGSTGAAVQSLAYDAWGLRRNPANWAALGSPFGGTEATERGYTGHEHLDGVELIHMNGRVQDPKLGGFISPDPFVQAPYHSQSLNRYSYVWNNPASLIDPSGFETNDVRNPWICSWILCPREVMEALERIFGDPEPYSPEEREALLTPHSEQGYIDEVLGYGQGVSGSGNLGGGSGGGGGAVALPPRRPGVRAATWGEQFLLFNPIGQAIARPGDQVAPFFRRYGLPVNPISGEFLEIPRQREAAVLAAAAGVFATPRSLAASAAPSLVVGSGARPGAITVAQDVLAGTPSVFGRVGALPFRTGSMSSVALEGLPYTALTPRAFSEAARVLSAGGRMTGSTGRGANLDIIRSGLQQAGFRDIQVGYGIADAVGNYRVIFSGVVP